jgi:ribosomal protein S12 methylthiotransferase
VISVGRSYRDAPEVDGVVLVRGRFEPGTFVRARITAALPYDLVGEATGATSTRAPEMRAPSSISGTRN